ncbi:MAG: type II/IV secretion system protein, partial [Planctomycetaceae bacterium]
MSDVCQQLVESGLISADQLAEAETMATSLGIRTEDALEKLGYVDATEISSLQAAEFGYDAIDLAVIEVPQAVIGLVPESVARENVVLPLRVEGESLVVAINDP